MTSIRAFATGLFLAFLIPVAIADPAITNAPTSLLSAPGTKSRILLHIPANAEVDVLSCRPSWCEISWRSTFGFAPARNLDLGAVPDDGPAYRGSAYAPPLYAFPPPRVYGGGIVIGPRPRVWSFGW